MSMPRPARAITVLSALASATVACADTPRTPRLGSPVPAELARQWSSTVFPDGRGLPPGKGTSGEGRAIYDEKCSACHGPEGRGETAEELVGIETPLTDADAAQTVGSYWPYAATLFDYTRRAMPMDKPGSLTPDETYALAAYLLHLNGIIGASDEMNAQSLPKVRMPNRDGFKRIDVE